MLSFSARKCFSLFLLLSTALLHADINDSLIRVTKTGSDEQKLAALIQLGKRNSAADLNVSLSYSRQALALAEKTGDESQKAWALNYIGSAFYYHGNYDSALHYGKEALAIRLRIHDAKGLGASYNNLGNIYDDQGNAALALDYYLKARKYFEECNFKDGIAITYNSIGNLYYYQKNYDKALEFFTKFLELQEKSGNTESMIHAYNNIAVAWDDKGDQKKALEYYNRALDLAKVTENTDAILTCYGNLAQLYNAQNDYYKAEDCFRKVITINKSYGDSTQLITTFANMASMFRNKGVPDSALHYHQLSLDLALKAKLISHIASEYLFLSEVYGDKKDFAKAFEAHKNYSRYRDSLLNEDNNRQIAEMNTKYETAKKDKELAQQNIQINKQEAEARQKSIIIYATVVGLILMLTLVFFVWNAYKNKEKANAIISQQKREVEHQKNVIEEKQKEIIDSINYAKRIQKAQLPTEASIDKNLKRLMKK